MLKSVFLCFLFFYFFIDDAEMLTSEMHDPYTRKTVAWKKKNRTAQKHLQRGSGVEPAKYPPKVKSENAFTTLEC